MSCKCALYNGEGRYNCSVSGDGCMFLIPNSKACAEKFGEGPDAYDDSLIVDENKEVKEE